MSRRHLRLEHPNMRGDDVRRLQELLVARGFDGVGEPDGIFGPDTQDAVEAFQAAEGLLPTGRVGSETWRVLDPEVEGDGAAGGGDAPSADVSAEQLRRIAPRARAADLGRYVAPLNATMTRFGITTPLRRAHFLAQVAHESGSFRFVRENLNYGADALLRVFRRHFPDRATAERYARKPEEIANRVYADRMGNGPEESGDGWRYRGRGLIQLTGRENYTTYGRAIGKAVAADPESVADDAQEATNVAGWYWDSRRINRLADQDDVVAVTRAINGGTNGLDDRRELLGRAKAALL